MFPLDPGLGLGGAFSMWSPGTGMLHGEDHIRAVVRYERVVSKNILSARLGGTHL